MQCKVKWSGTGMALTAQTESGHVLPIDASPQVGGNNTGPRPMELMLCAVGGCTSIDVLMILQRGRHQVSGCEVSIEAERAQIDPKVFTEIRLHFHIKGKDLPEAAVERAIQLSREKYCSAILTVAKTATIHTSFELENAAS